MKVGFAASSKQGWFLYTLANPFKGRGGDCGGGGQLEYRGGDERFVFGELRRRATSTHTVDRYIDRYCGDGNKCNSSCPPDIIGARKRWCEPTGNSLSTLVAAKRHALKEISQVGLTHTQLWLHNAPWPCRAAPRAC